MTYKELYCTSLAFSAFSSASKRLACRYRSAVPACASWLLALLLRFFTSLLVLGSTWNDSQQVWGLRNDFPSEVLFSGATFGLSLKALFSLFVCYFGLREQTTLNVCQGHLDAVLGSAGAGNLSSRGLQCAIPQSYTIRVKALVGPVIRFEESQTLCGALFCGPSFSVNDVRLM